MPYCTIQTTVNALACLNVVSHRAREGTVSLNQSTRTIQDSAPKIQELLFYQKEHKRINLSAVELQTKWYSSVQFSSVAQSCPTLCDPMNRSTPGLPVHHQVVQLAFYHCHRGTEIMKNPHQVSYMHFLKGLIKLPIRPY